MAGTHFARGVVLCINVLLPGVVTAGMFLEGGAYERGMFPEVKAPYPVAGSTRVCVAAGRHVSMWSNQ